MPLKNCAGMGTCEPIIECRMSEKSDNSQENPPAELKEAAVLYRADDAGVYPLRTAEDRGWDEFRDQCRRQMQRPLALRMKYGFMRRRRGKDEAGTSRAFNTMEEYRAWCEANYPSYFGYRRSSK
jgi:hypothetical protein